MKEPLRDEWPPEDRPSITTPRSFLNRDIPEKRTRSKDAERRKNKNKHSKLSRKRNR